MLLHFLKSGVAQARLNVGMFVLVVSMIALGTGLAMTMWATVYSLGRNPLPEKSTRLFHVQLDPRPSQDGQLLSDYLTRLDAEALLAGKAAKRQVAMASGSTLVTSDNTPRSVHVASRYTTPDFFPMFEVPFLQGRGWTEKEESQGARVVVLDARLAVRLLGTSDAVNSTLSIDGIDFRVIGVVNSWSPLPRFYDLSGDFYRTADELWVPLQSALDAGLKVSGKLECWGDIPDSEDARASKSDPRRSVNAPCSWITYWAELGSANDRQNFERQLESRLPFQTHSGSVNLEPRARVMDLGEWMRHNKVVPDDVWMQSWIAAGLLLAAMISASGLLLSLFFRRAHEVSVRRALGASRASILVQMIFESLIIGGAGACLGLALAASGVALLRSQDYPYAELTHLSALMIATCLAVAVLTTVLAALVPAWHSTRVSPKRMLNGGMA